MKPVTGYAEAKATNFNAPERLPVGGYVLRILDVKEVNYQWGDVIILRFNIAEGEQKGFFDKQYKAISMQTCSAFSITCDIILFLLRGLFLGSI